jgi:uncharacterized membrane protein YoaK (UPF0700 family)
MLSTLAMATRLGGGSGADNGRRVLAISSMLVGGLIGALLALRVGQVAPLVLAAGVLAGVWIAALPIERRLRR